jgi:hypothetical protein
MIFSDGCHRGRRMQSIPLCSGFLVLAAWLMMTGSGIAFDQPPSTGPVRELRVGALAHDVDGLWSGDAKEAGPDFCLEVLFNRRLFDLLSATAYPDAGASLNTRGDTSKIYGDFCSSGSRHRQFSFQRGSAWFCTMASGIRIQPAVNPWDRGCCSEFPSKSAMSSAAIIGSPLPLTMCPMPVWHPPTKAWTAWGWSMDTVSKGLFILQLPLPDPAGVLSHFKSTGPWFEPRFTVGGWTLPVNS